MKCGCGRAIRGTYTPDQCRLCWLFINDQRYRAKWLGLATQCVHLGEQIDLRDCPTCGGKHKVKVKVFACAEHGSCTIGKPLSGEACCLKCPDKQVKNG